MVEAASGIWIIGPIVAGLAVAALAGVAFSDNEYVIGVFLMLVGFGLLTTGMIHAEGNIVVTSANSEQFVTIVRDGLWQPIEACQAQGGLPLTRPVRIPGTVAPVEWATMLDQCLIKP